MDEGAQPMLRSRLTQLDKDIAELQPKLDDARSKWEANPQSTVAEEIYKDLKKKEEKLLDVLRALVDKLPGGHAWTCRLLLSGSGRRHTKAT